MAPLPWSNPAGCQCAWGDALCLAAHALAHACMPQDCLRQVRSVKRLLGDSTMASV